MTHEGQFLPLAALVEAVAAKVVALGGGRALQARADLVSWSEGLAARHEGALLIPV